MEINFKFGYAYINDDNYKLGEHQKIIKKLLSEVDSQGILRVNKISQFDNDWNKYKLHIHCPEAATAKDGPSAGITITTGIYSLLTETSKSTLPSPIILGVTSNFKTAGLNEVFAPSAPVAWNWISSP